MKFISPSWDSIFSQSVTLAQKIRFDQVKLKKPHIDTIVGVSRGGLVLARLMSDLLEIQNVIIAKSEYYTNVGKKNKKPIITQKLRESLRSKNVLLVDDVADTGESLIAVRKHLESKNPRAIVVATLYVKPWSKMMPDYCVSRTDAWIIFPWEYYEAYRQLTGNKEKNMLSQSKIPKNVIDRLKLYDKLTS